jgi:hypothetical protein
MRVVGRSDGPVGPSLGAARHAWHDRHRWRHPVRLARFEVLPLSACDRPEAGYALLTSVPPTIHLDRASFDARTKWPSCKKAIRDQAQCGSCWAFAAAETLTDNLCVLGKAPPVLSPQDLVSCDKTDHGCHGGTLPSAWQFVDSNGLVSDTCMPYASGDGSNHTCPLPGCTGSGSAAPHKCPVKPSFLSSDSAIQAAVMTVGAVEVGFCALWPVSTRLRLQPLHAACLAATEPMLTTSNRGSQS